MRKIISTSKVSKRELVNKEISRKIASEGIVLLENDGTLPITYPQKIVLLGNGARETIRGGDGSGEVNVREFTTIEQGLEKAGFDILTTSLLDDYSSFLHLARDKYERDIKEIATTQGPQTALIHSMEQPFQAPTYRALTDKDIESYKVNTAFYVISRTSGEGADRQFLRGDYLLTEEEISDITLLAKKFNKFILLLNIGGVIDIQPLKEIPGINSILHVSQGGSAFGDAVADVLTGKVVPSGKLTTSWAKAYEDYPNSSHFANLDGNADDSYYNEGIYVGYRYFDSYQIIPQYAFGYGKSYTDFAISFLEASIEKTTITLSINVKNIGRKYSGKEVIQIYSSAPQGKLDKPYQELQAFKKTEIIAPGETETLNISFSLMQLASYDTETSSYILEPGNYLIRLGNSSRNTQIVVSLYLECLVITEKCQKAFIDEIPSEQNWNKPNFLNDTVPDEIPTLTINPESFTTIIHQYEQIKEIPISNTKQKVTLDNVKDGNFSLNDLVSQLSVPELAHLCVGGARMDFKDFSVIGNAADTIPGAAGETTKFLLEDRSIPSLTMADGPSGIRVNPIYYEKDGVLLKDLAQDPIFKNILPDNALKTDLNGATVYYQYCTALPIATMLAQTWNTDCLYEAGKLIATELDEVGINLWLAPGMNIHRNPLCGRNFEYYSEDPLLSGVFAAATTRGVHTSKRQSTTIKHFAANNQETNRNYNNSHISERALREIYLRGFQICIESAHPKAVMTSLNLINGVHAANSYDLLTKLLRDEWLFTGLVMTDWGATSNFGVDASKYKYPSSSSVQCITAGNDLIMPGSQNEVDILVKSYYDGNLDKAFLQNCAKHVLSVILALDI